jgi:hypothetical protein
MKIEPRPATHHEDTTAEFEAGTGTRVQPKVHRRTTVTVERETLSVLIPRSVVEPANQPADGGASPEPPEVLRRSL